MIEVTIHFGTLEGSGIVHYLVDVPVGSAGAYRGSYFKTDTWYAALSRALGEFAGSSKEACISRIDVRETANKVLEL